MKHGSYKAIEIGPISGQLAGGFAQSAYHIDASCRYELLGAICCRNRLIDFMVGAFRGLSIQHVKLWLCKRLSVTYPVWFEFVVKDSGASPSICSTDH